jgi:hypothetical protein
MPATDDVLRVTARLTMYDEDFQNVYHIQALGATTDGDWDDACATWLDGAYNRFSAAYSDEIDRQDIVIQNLTEGTPARFHDWDTYPTPSDTNPVLPLQVSALALFPSNRVRSIGRKYIGGWTESDNEEPGVPSSGVLTAMANYAADLLAGFTVGIFTQTPGNYDYDGSNFWPWIFAQVATYWATQRRRRAGVGS